MIDTDFFLKCLTHPSLEGQYLTKDGKVPYPPAKARFDYIKNPRKDFTYKGRKMLFDSSLDDFGYPEDWCDKNAAQALELMNHSYANEDREITEEQMPYVGPLHGEMNESSIPDNFDNWEDWIRNEAKLYTKN